LGVGMASESTTYLARNALDRLRAAQAVVDWHAASGVDGRCLRCGQPEPCRSRIAASAVFARYGRLPRRRPGLASRALR
jgi:hypothetical protein